MKLKLGCVAFNAIVGVEDPSILGKALENEKFHETLKGVFADFGILVVTKVQGTGVVSAAEVDYEEPKVIKPIILN